MAVTFTQAQIDAFIDSMNKNPGVLSMTIGDRQYTFETLEQKREHLAYMQRNLATASGTAATVMRVAQTSKGFC